MFRICSHQDHSDPSFARAIEKAKDNGYPFILQQFGFWAVYVMHTADPRLGTFPADTTMKSRKEAAMPIDDDDESDAESSELFHPTTTTAAAKPSGIITDAEWNADLKSINEVDQSGYDIDINRQAEDEARTAVAAKKDPQKVAKPKEEHNPDFDRVYECETFLDAFVVWCIALLHTKGGIIDNIDLSFVLCDLFEWPHPQQATE